MALLNEYYYETLQLIVDLKQKQLHEFLQDMLENYYDEEKIIRDKAWTYVEGDIPVALVAHMDTVFPEVRDTSLFYDREKEVICCPFGAGFDDRAGILGIIYLLNMGYRPHIILTTDEECGGLGAVDIATNMPLAALNLKYMIELDRQGCNECVFYYTDNKDFKDYVTSFGFEEERGLFSDISILSPCWGIASVNLSIGYWDEHTLSETLWVEHFFLTIKKVCEMLNEANDGDVKSFTTTRYNFSFGTEEEKGKENG